MIEQLFIRVLNMSLTAGIVILAVLALRLLFRKAPKIFSYALWAVVLFRLLCPVSFSFEFSLLEFLRAPFAESGQMVYIPENIEFMIQPEINFPVPAIRDAVNSSLPSAAVESSVNPMQILLSAGAVFWLTGILIMAGYSAVSCWKLQRKLKMAVREYDNIFHASGIRTPFVCGIFHARIYLPSILREREKEYIVLHEQIHLRRGDHIWRILSYLALCIHWFNPLAWAAFFLSGKDMEMSCDEAVIQTLGNDVKKEYSASLLSFASGRRIISDIPLAFGGSETGSRIKNILRYRKPAGIAAIAALMICVMAAVFLTSNPVSVSDAAKSIAVMGEGFLIGRADSGGYWSTAAREAEFGHGITNEAAKQEQTPFLTTEQLMAGDVDDGKYRAYVCSISRSARGIDRYFAGLEDNGQLPFLAFAEDCRFFIRQETERLDYDEVSFEGFADLTQEMFSYRSPLFLLTFENGQITEVALED